MSSSDSKSIVEFAKRLGFFLLPVCLLVTAVIVIDPYNLFWVSKVIDNSIKLNTSRKVDERLWEILEYERNPYDSILLGDSRMKALDVHAIEESTGKRYYNFAYNGGTLPEIIDTFWFAANSSNLKTVYIGINFNLFNAKNNYNFFQSADSVRKNHALYFVNNNVIKSCSYNLYAYLFNRNYSISLRPKMDKEVFWKSQLGPVTKTFYCNYVYPIDYLAELVRISDYSRKRGIKLTFIIPPTHLDLQEKVGEYGLSMAEERFKTELMKLASVYDFNYANEFTSNKSNFLDPYHIRDPKIVIDSVWGTDRRYVRVIER